MSSFSASVEGQQNFWLQRRGVIYSGVGGARLGSDVYFRQFSMIEDLLGQCSWVQVLVLNATGVMISAQAASWLEAAFIGTSYPDARIWCNQIAALAADQGTCVVAAVAAGVLSADSRAYGGSQTTRLGMQFLRRAYRQYQSSNCLETIVKAIPLCRGKPMATGFARPLDLRDERISPLLKLLTQAGLQQRAYISLALSLNDHFKQLHQLEMNVGGLMSAFLLDLGFTPDQGYAITAGAVLSGLVACYQDNLTPEHDHAFLPLCCEDVKYTGPAPRALPQT